MDYQKILFGVLFGILGQTGTFLQLQGSYKYGWYEKYFWLILFASVPLGYLYIKSVQFFIVGFGGQIWPSRLVGFAVGIIIFTLMSYLLFKEPLNLKNSICLGLGFLIILVQLFVK
jgi:multidrug transporter EmrE-like cation transporter